MNDAAESEYEVSKAFYKRLNDATASGQSLEGIGVYDRVPQGAAFPYITIGTMDTGDFSDKSASGMDVTCELHIWSQSPTSKELKTIAAKVYNLLHNIPLTGMVGQINYLLRYINGNIMPVEQDNITCHAVQRYRILTRATA